MTQPRFLENETAPGRLGAPQWLLAAVALGLVTLFAWAALAEIEQIVRATGQVIAVARTQVIQAQDGGVLAELLVREGDRVRKGQLLARLDDTRARAAYADSLNKVGALRAAQIRLRAEVFGQPLEFPDGIAAPEFVRNQTELFHRRQQALNEGVAALEKTLGYVRTERQINLPLLRSGDIGELEVVRMLKQESELEGQIVNLKNKYFGDAQLEMTKVDEDLANAEQVLAERAVVLEYTELKASADGLVKRIAVTTPGAAVRQGDVVMELLPTRSDLVLEAKVAPADIASVHAGQPVSAKLDAFDSSIYGGLDGEVVYVSPDALTESDPRRGEIVYYRVHVRVDPPDSSPNPRTKEIVVQPGMTAMAEIRAQKRTVLNFLTKPVTKTLSSALTER